MQSSFKKAIISHKIIIIIVLITTLVLCSRLVTYLANENNKYYSCIYRPDMEIARCDVISDPSCLGYYPLKGKDIKEGIVTSGGNESTCEGLTAPERYYFSKSGDFIEVKPFSEGLGYPDI